MTHGSRRSVAPHVEHVRAVEPARVSRPLHDVQKFPTQRQHAATFVFGQLWSQSHHAAGQVDVAPFKPAHFAHPPAGEVQERHRVLQVVRQRALQCEEAAVVEEPLPRVMFFEHRNERAAREPAGLDSQGEHAPERCQLAVDACVHGAGLLACGNVPCRGV